MPSPFVVASAGTTLTSSPVTVPVTAATAAGDGLVVAVLQNKTGSTLGVSDSQGNLYAQISGSPVTTSVSMSIWTAVSGPGGAGTPVAALGGSDSFSATFTTVSGNYGVVAVSTPGFTAVDAATLFMTAVATATATETITTADTGDMCLGIFEWNGAGGAGSVSDGLFTQLANFQSSYFVAASYYQQTSPGSVTASYTFGTATAWRAAVIGLQPRIGAALASAAALTPALGWTPALASASGVAVAPAAQVAVNAWRRRAGRPCSRTSLLWAWRGHRARP